MFVLDCPTHGVLKKSIDVIRVFLLTFVMVCLVKELAKFGRKVGYVRSNHLQLSIAA